MAGRQDYETLELLLTMEDAVGEGVLRREGETVGLSVAYHLFVERRRFEGVRRGEKDFVRYVADVGLDDPEPIGACLDWVRRAQVERWPLVLELANYRRFECQFDDDGRLISRTTGALKRGWDRPPTRPSAGEVRH